MSPKSLFKLLAVLLLLTLILENYIRVEGSNNRQSSIEEDMELDNKLRILNKPPVKTIKTKFGDIYDCINIYKQPAFDHPLLKNHKIQMKPNVVQEEQTNKRISNEISSVARYKIEGCPSGTVPIRRTNKEDLTNAKHLFNWIKLRHYVSVQPSGDDVFYGGSAQISVANPVVDPNKYSTGQIWIENGPYEELNSIEFGWAVHPQLFGDNDTRVFGLWTADGFSETGCYNMLCPGFVQIHPEYTFGEHIRSGTYGSENQRAFYFSVHRDPESGNWWFINGIDNAKIGYWPKEIFTHLSSNASIMAYGGIVGGNLGELAPPMGYGHLPVPDCRYTCCQLHMKVVNNQGDHVEFDKPYLSRDTKTSCYDLIFQDRDISLGNIMFFGGPGGDCRTKYN